MDMLDEERIQLEAQQARQILANPLFQRHNERLIKGYHEAWEGLEQGVDDREELWLRMRAVRAYIEELEQYLNLTKQKSED